RPCPRATAGRADAADREDWPVVNLTKPASALAAILALGLSFHPASASPSGSEAPLHAELQKEHSTEAARERLRRFLARLAPGHADDFRWRRAGAGGQEIRLPGATECALRAGKARWRSETGAFLVTPDLEALDLSLEFDWRKSRLDAASLAVSGEYLLIEGIRLANQGGLLEIERMHGPADAIGLLLAALLEGDLSRPSSGPVAIEGMALRAIDHERGNRRFSSAISAARIVLDGLMAGEIEGERLLVASSVQIAEMSGEAE